MFKIKKLISLTLIALMMISMIPQGLAQALEYQPDKLVVDEVIIGKEYDSNRFQTGMFISIKGKYLQNAPVFLDFGGARTEQLKNPKINTYSRLNFEFTNPAQWEKLKNIKSIGVGNGNIDIDGRAEMPSITDVTPKVNISKAEELRIAGTGFNLITNNSDDFTVGFGSSIGFKIIDNSKFNQNPAVITDFEEHLGLQDINITREFDVEKVYFNEDNKEHTVKFKIDYTYNDQFRLVENLSISDDIEMFPNRGLKGSKVYFQANMLRDYDVYFLSSLDIPYTAAVRGKNPIYQQGTVDNEGNKLTKDLLIVEVPDIDVGEYHVVLTNKVGAKDPMEAIHGEWIYKEKFTVIDGAKSATIDAIQPNRGPDTGSPAVITGRYLGTLNIDDLKIEENNGFTLKETEKGLFINYNVSGSYRNTAFDSITKRITVIVGNQAMVKESSTFSEHVDRLDIHINAITELGQSPVRDVVVETETILKDGDKPLYTFTERAEKPKGYTFISSRVQPEVQDIIPKEIYVEKKDNEYIVPRDLMIGIYGKNFTVYEYVYGTNVGVSYPIVSFGEDKGFVLNKKNSAEFYVFDDKGEPLDGTSGNEVGSKILAVIKAGAKVPEGYLDRNVPVIVTNPMRNSLEPGLSSDTLVMVKFLEAKADKEPVIESVSPNVVTVDGGEEVIIRGSNFQADAKVIIDGKEVTGIKREGDGKTITFKAPPGREGVTQLQVINPDGGIAIRPFQYVKTYTNPKITDFSPKAGNTSTLVMVTGDNFLPPDPTATSSDIYKLIGTRILLGNEDINEYNEDPDTKKIILQYYKSPENDEILRLEETPAGSKYLHMADYWHSVLFSDDSGKFYTLRQDARGNPVLSDGVQSTYTLSAKAEGIYASRTGGSIYPLSVTTGIKAIDGKDVEVTQLIIGENQELVLTMQTPFKIDKDGRIIGNNVKVLDKNHILFKVPILTRGDGYYDLTVLNPDTKRDSRRGQQGFYYYSLPTSEPKIDEVIPEKGSTDGGYTIDIIGKDFKDDGTFKSRVFINGVEVKREDAFVSVDGTKITVKVPPYTGDLSKERETDRITVPVVVLNPDGASASKEDGFTYVVPTSHPEITRIVPRQGSAAGKEVVEIIGKDFRYFEPYSDDNRNQRYDEGEPYQDLNYNGMWDDFRLKAVKDKLEKENKYDPNKDLIQNLRGFYGDTFDDIVAPVLPKVYFGSEVAEIIEYDDGYIKVLTPPGTAGDVDVYVVNNDSGISNKVKYTYMATNPGITKIVPQEGRKQGGDRVEVFGSNFVESEVRVLRSDKSNPELENLNLIRFGNITNRDIPRDGENSGRIDNKRTTVNLPGGLKVEYRDGRVNIEIQEQGRTYARIIPYDGTPLYISTRGLKDGDNNYPYDELIRLEINDRRLFVERGYAPQVKFLNSGQLVVTTPAYYTIGLVDVSLINPDGGMAQGKFEYKNPESKPYIINLTKEGKSPVEESINGRDVKVLRMTYKGGNVVSVIGGDFRENARIQISNLVTIEPKDITYMLPTKMTFTMPEVPEEAVGKLHRVVVLNEDGGSGSSDEASPKPIYIMFVKGETNPAVTKLTPDMGPTSGGTKVTIEGKDFREGLKVYFGGVPVPEEDVKVVDYKTIIVITPPHPAGKVEVKIENPDGELSSPNGVFTYLSSPKIAAVLDPQDATETTRITRISIEGGQRVKIKGTSFMSGARVIFAPKIKRIDDEDKATGTIIYIEGIPYSLEEGTDGSNVEYIDSETLLVTTPPGKLDSKGVLVINPDGGATDIYDNIVYTLPELLAPTNVVAELIYDRYIKITWGRVDKAEGYEIFAVVDDNEIDFVGSTELTSFIYRDLESDTRYRFIIKAIGPFGASPPSAESNTVRTGRRVGPPDEDGELAENTTKQKIGDTAHVVIGTEDYKENTTLDLTDTAFAGVKKAVINIPAEVATKSYTGSITIIGRDFTLKFSPEIFDTTKVRQNKDRRDAGIRFEISQYEGSPEVKDMTTLSNQYNLKAEFYLGKDISVIDHVRGTMDLIVEYDKTKADLRRLSQVALYKYDDYTSTWQHVSQRQWETDISIRTFINYMGRFAIMGSRR